MAPLTRGWMSSSLNSYLFWAIKQWTNANVFCMHQSKRHCHYLQNVINIPVKQLLTYTQSRTLSTNTTLFHVLSPSITLSSLLRLPAAASSTSLRLLLCNRTFSKNNTKNYTFDSCYHKCNQTYYCKYVLSSRQSPHFHPFQPLLDNYRRVRTQTEKRSYSSKTTVRNATIKTMEVPEGVFRGCVDRFNGIIVESVQEYDENTDFPEKLQASLDYWMSIKRRTIWFTVQREHAPWVPHLANAGFDFHHVNTTPSAVVMYRWLPTDEYANIPTFCHTMLGVGGLVVNDNNEVLVVSDRYALIPNSWKLPGGYVEPGEEIVAAAIREVKEETGIDAEFRTVISIRHSHSGSFGCSDMYVVVALKPLNSEVIKCEREIAKAQWMPIKDYLQHPDVHETNRHFVRTYLDYEKRNIRFTYERAQHQILKREYTLFYMKPLENENVNKIEK